MFSPFRPELREHYFTLLHWCSKALELTNILRANVTTAEAGQCVSLALKRVRRAAVRKGMVLVHKSEILPRG